MAEKRDTLTKLLLDLIEKKQARADDLQKIMREMEGEKEKEHENYWLIQYQKLLDSKPKGLAAAEDKLDPKVRNRKHSPYKKLPENTTKPISPLVDFSEYTPMSLKSDRQFDNLISQIIFSLFLFQSSVIGSWNSYNIIIQLI